MTTTTTAKNLQVGDRFSFQTKSGRWTPLLLVTGAKLEGDTVRITAAPLAQTDTQDTRTFAVDHLVRIHR